MAENSELSELGQRYLVSQLGVGGFVCWAMDVTLSGTEVGDLVEEISVDADADDGDAGDCPSVEVRHRAPAETVQGVWDKTGSVIGGCVGFYTGVEDTTPTPPRVIGVIVAEDGEELERWELRREWIVEYLDDGTDQGVEEIRRAVLSTMDTFTAEG